VTLDERVEIDRIQVPPFGPRESGNVARRDRFADPLREGASIIPRSDLATPLRNLSQSP
jgi:hypothetical protein